MSAMTDEPGEAGEAAETLRYEQEHQERIDRRNAASWKAVGVVIAAALALLAYDSGSAALTAHRDGRPWLYPACVSTACTLLILALLTYALWHRRRGSA
jgi:protein-S-isoprenylcysteine O-methyltransferase Ste14